MAEYSNSLFTDKTAKHVALLQYVADQLRCYADELSAKDGVLSAFADMLDELAGDMDSATGANSAAKTDSQPAVQ